MKRTVVILATAILVAPVHAQRWQWPDNPKNLTILPKTTTGRELQRTMQSFTSGLGVRCVYCHVGEEGKDFSEFDFASDSKPEKVAARVMIKMMNAINTNYLPELPAKPMTVMYDRPNPKVEVSCITCHRGNAQPIMLEDKLKKTFDVSGVDSTIRQYRALRDQYYGGFVYNFKEGTLLRLADKILADTTQTSAAIAVVRLNIEMFPSFAFSYVHLANIYEGQGNTQAAIENYQQAIKLDPGDERIKRQLERLQNKK